MRISDWSSDVCSSDLIPPKTESRPGPITVAVGESKPQQTMQQRLDEARKVQSDNDAARTKGHSTANYQTHKVRRGQTLSGIAHQYNVSLNELRHANGIKGSELRSEEHTSELQSLMRISYAVFC